MRRTVLFLALAALFVTLACGGVSTSTPATEQPAAAGLTPGNAYICPMHPDVTSGAPGKCPKCEMNLITMEEFHKQGGKM